MSKLTNEFGDIIPDKLDNLHPFLQLTETELREKIHTMYMEWSLKMHETVNGWIDYTIAVNILNQKFIKPRKTQTDE